MNYEIAMQWAKKLETENIPQLQGALGNARGERCCLGVLCDIAVVNKIIPAPHTEGCPCNDDGHRLSYDGEHALLPESVGHWAGMNTLDGFFYESGKIGPTVLTKLNDNGVPFHEIAAIIRDNWAVL